METDQESLNHGYEQLEVGGGVPIRAWTKGVCIEDAARRQLENIARMPFIHGWVAAMPDVHLGIGATVGSVIPTIKAIIPAAVGVDIGCGMMALKTSLNAKDLPDSLAQIRSNLESVIPTGRNSHTKNVPQRVVKGWESLTKRFENILAEHPQIRNGEEAIQLGTLGGGNHFIEICLDEFNNVWIMLHSGSSNVGNRIGKYFIELAKNDMLRLQRRLPDVDLAYFDEGTEHFDSYVRGVTWAQEYALKNRQVMMDCIIETLRKSGRLPQFKTNLLAVNCHHNYVSLETHFGEEVYLTRKGAVSAKEGELGIIPGSMGTRSYIVKGKGNVDSYNSCSHGAGRIMSRSAAKKAFTVADHELATAGVECRKDVGVLDETPAAYKNIDDVMKAQSDLVDILYTLKQVVCIKG